MLKEIKNYPNYFVDENGLVYSSKNKNKEPREIKPWLDSQGRYLMVGLCKENKVKKFLVHRLVAEAFLENEDNFQVVDHIDNNTLNNKAINLQWCSTKFNVNKTYLTKGPIRNHCECLLYIDSKLIGEFVSAIDACRYASDKYGFSKTALYKHYKHKNCVIVKKCNDYSREGSRGE